MKSQQFNIEMIPPQKTHRTPLSDHDSAIKAEKEEAHRCFKLHKSNHPWRFSDREKKLLKKYYGITVI